jgi:hypothetical protein
MKRIGFKEWWMNIHPSYTGSEVHPTAHTVMKYLQEEGRHPHFCGVIFDDEIHFKGEFENLSFEDCVFKKGIVLEDLNVYHTVIIKNTNIFGQIKIINVYLNQGFTTDNKSVVHSGIQAVCLLGTLHIRKVKT